MIGPCHNYIITQLCNYYIINHGFSFCPVSLQLYTQQMLLGLSELLGLTYGKIKKPLSIINKTLLVGL